MSDTYQMVMICPTHGTIRDFPIHKDWNLAKADAQIRYRHSESCQQVLQTWIDGQQMS